MSLCCTIIEGKKFWLEELREAREYCDIGDKGFYHFLVPTFEAIGAKTGELVDLYGLAEYKGKELEIVLQELRALKERIATAAEHIVVNSGWIEHSLSGSKELTYTLNRSDLDAQVQHLSDLATDAARTNRVLFFKGD